MTSIGPLSEEVVGELLFGRPLRLRVLRWLANRGPGQFSQAVATRGVAGRTDYVGLELDRLCQLGLARRLARLNKRRPQSYVRIEGPAWTGLAELFAALEAAAMISRPSSRDGDESTP